MTTTIGQGDRAFARHLLLSWLLHAAVIIAIVAWFFSDVNWAFVRGLDFSVVYTYRVALLQGLLHTISITFASLLLGLALGLAFACLLYLPFAPVRWLIQCYIEILRDTPLVVALFWIHFALPVATGISTTAFQSGFVAMALQSSAYLADVVRAGIQAVPRGQWDAADSLGLSRLWKWLDIVLPLAFRISLPALNNNLVNLVKTTTLAYAIAVPEMLYVSSQIWSDELNVPVMMNVLLICYFLLVGILVYLMHRWERAIRVPGFGI